MGKLFCLMGKSSTGKDTIFSKLREDTDLGLLPVVPYTTRPMRSYETNGVEYFFIDAQTLDRYKKEGKVIELREYNTAHGVWTYCTMDDGQINLAENNYLLITTLVAYKKLREYFTEEKVVPIYITVDDGVRLERALNRERQQANPKYAELCRRYLSDEIDFSEENLKDCGIHNYFENRDLGECVSSIKKAILTAMD